MTNTKATEPRKLDWPDNLMVNLGILEIDPERRLGMRGEVEIAMLLARLTEGEQTVIRERYMEGKSLAEVGGNDRSRQAVHELEKRAFQRLMIAGSDSAFILVNGLRAWLDIEVEKRLLLHKRTAEIETERMKDLQGINEHNTADDMLIEDLQMGIRSYNALRRVRIRTLGDFYKKIHDRYDLINVPGIGVKNAADIIKTLKRLGLPYNHLLDVKENGA